MSAAHNRVAVLHGVNFDILERRDAVDLRRPLARRAGAEDRRLGRASSGSRRSSSRPTRRREFVEYLHRLPDVADAVARQRRRLDPLQPRDRRRPRGRPPAGGRGPPLRRRVPRRLAPGLGLRRPGPAQGLGQGPRRLPRGARGARRRARGRRAEARSRRPPRRRCSPSASSTMTLVTELVNVTYLTGFGGTNGACLCGAGHPRLLHRLPLHRAGRGRGRGLGGGHRHRRLARAGSPSASPARSASRTTTSRCGCSSDSRRNSPTG